MFGLSNHEGVWAIFVFDILLSWILGEYIDRDQYLYPIEYQERIGCLFFGPVLFIFNLAGVFTLAAMNLFGILGPWWTWAVGISLPYILIVVLLFMGKSRQPNVSINS